MCRSSESVCIGNDDNINFICLLLPPMLATLKVKVVLTGNTRVQIP